MKVIRMKRVANSNSNLSGLKVTIFALALMTAAPGSSSLASQHLSGDTLTTYGGVVDLNLNHSGIHSRSRITRSECRNLRQAVDASVMWGAFAVSTSGEGGRSSDDDTRRPGDRNAIGA